MNVVPVKIRKGLYIIVEFGSGTSYKGAYSYRKVFTHAENKVPLKAETYTDALKLAHAVAQCESKNRIVATIVGGLPECTAWFGNVGIDYNHIWLEPSAYAERLAKYKATMLDRKLAR